MLRLVAIAVTALAALPSAALARLGLGLKLAHGPASGRVLGGITSQGWPVVMAISKNEQQVVGVIAGLVLNCNSGQQFTVEDAWSKLRIGPAGAVNTSAAVRPSPPGSGTSVTGGTRSLKGKLNRRTGNFTGVWHVQLNFTTTGGPDQCDSGDVAFALKL